MTAHVASPLDWSKGTLASVLPSVADRLGVRRHAGSDVFDLPPATRAVVVARPTYSQNIYQQMIGRGLRGPKNGGKETCLILNVRDNVTNYGEKLAFTDFDMV